MTGGSARRLGAAALAVACLVVRRRAGRRGGSAPTLSVNDRLERRGQHGHVHDQLSPTARTRRDVTSTAADVRDGASGYTTRDETVTIPAGQTTANFDVTTNEERPRRARPQFTRHAVGSVGGATHRDATGTGTITDDDATPTLAISGAAPIEEGAALRRTRSRSPASPRGTVTVNYATANGTATAGPTRTTTPKSGHADVGCRATRTRSRSTSRSARTRSTRTTRPSPSRSRARANANDHDRHRDDDDHRR